MIVKSTEFQNWFENSKAVNDAGEPMTLYHGTSNVFYQFTDKDQRQGFYFSEDPKYANTFAEGEEANVLPVYLSIKNPADIRYGISSSELRQALRNVDYDTSYLDENPPTEYWNLFDGATEFAEALQRAGYDGVRLTEPPLKGKQYYSWMAFRPEQVKSAIGNNGDFDPANPDIRFSRAATQPAPLSNFDVWFGDSKIIDRSGDPLVVYHGTTENFDKFQSMASKRVFFLDGIEIERADSWDMGSDYTGKPDAYHYGALSSAEVLGCDIALRHHETEAQNLEFVGPDTTRVLHDLRRMVGKVLTASNVVRPINGGFFFTPDVSYSFIAKIGSHDGGNVMPVYLSIKNPVYLNASQVEQAGDAFNIEKYRAQGYDGAVFAEHQQDLARRGWNGSTQIVAFDDTQIKSAIGNSGDYDPENPDIRFSRMVEETPALADWFEGSKVTDDLGNPLMVYHATTEDFDEFKPGGKDPLLSGRAIWFTPNREFQPAAHNIGRRRGFYNEGTRVIPAYVNIKRPLMIDADTKSWAISLYGDNFPQIIGNNALADIKQDYDGILFYDDKGKLSEVIAFEPSQITSALSKRRGYERSELGASSAELVAWFDQSKIVDSNGMPLVVYHGARPGVDISQFRARHDTDGIYFTPDPQYAEAFTLELFTDTGSTGAIHPVYLNIRNPYVVETEDGSAEWASFVDRGLNRIDLKSRGYDGAILRLKGGDIDQIIAFEPEQIKSALGNRGTYDPANPDIRFSRMPAVERSAVLRHTINIAQAEILRDIADDTLPETVADFSDLHDYLDANMYVNDADRQDRRIGPLGRSLGWKTDDFINFTNEAIEAIHEWLAAGRKGNATDYLSLGLTPALAAWFGQSKVVGTDGKPLVVYRGEHGETTDQFHSRMNSLSFGSKEAAISYAIHPNKHNEVPVAPRVIPVYLRILNPIVDNRDDPFVDLSDLSLKLGRDNAMRLAIKFAHAIENTGNWDENYSEKYSDVAALLADTPEALDSLFFDAYHLLDDADEVSRFKALGYDGAIHMGNGETAVELEYRVFDESQVKSAIGNTGEYAADNPDIRFSAGAPALDLLRSRAFSHAEMISRGADGNLTKGYERYVPLDKIDGLEPVPTNNESDDGLYHPGREIKQPIEVQYEEAGDLYMLYGGNHRVAQARANGQTHILAFVEPDHASGHDYIGTFARRDNPDGLPGSFARWLGDSKAVLANGMPQVFYRGDKTEQNVFDTSAKHTVDTKRLGAYFTANEAFAKTYGVIVQDVFLSVQNPFDIVGLSASDAIDKLPVDDQLKRELRSAFRGSDYSQYGLLETAAGSLREGLERAGYDGIKYTEGYADAYIVFHPQQIKSASMNKGAFDINNPNIRFSRFDELFGKTKSEEPVSLTPVAQLPLDVRLLIDDLESAGGSDGAFKIEAATLLNDPTVMLRDTETRVEEIGHASVSYTVDHTDRSILITTLHVPHKYRRQGAASAALQAIVDTADSVGYRLDALAYPQDASTPPKATIALFARYGFTKGGAGIRMIRNALPPALNLRDTSDVSSWNGDKGDSLSEKEIQSVFATQQVSEDRDPVPVVQSSEFRQWFDGSKIVDGNDKPLVVFHGTGSDFSVFESDAGRGAGHTSSRLGFWFSPDAQVADMFSQFAIGPSNIMPVYLAIKNPKVYAPFSAEELARREAEVASTKERIEVLRAEDGAQRALIDTYDMQERWARTERVVAAVNARNALDAEIVRLKAHIDDLTSLDPFEQMRCDMDENMSYLNGRANIRGAHKARFAAYPGGVNAFVSKLKNEGYDGLIIRETEWDVPDGVEKTTQIVAFEQTQIKSALGNVGTFDPANPDIRYARHMKSQQAFDTIVTGITGPTPIPLGDTVIFTKTPEAIFKSFKPELRGATQRNSMAVSAAVLDKMLYAHGLALSYLRKMPAMLADPVMVFESESEPDRLVVVTEMIRNGLPVVVVVQPRGIVDELILTTLPSAYPKVDKTAFARWTRNGLLRYANKVKSIQLAEMTGLQLPGVIQRAAGFRTSYLTPDGISSTAPEWTDVPMFSRQLAESSGDVAAPQLRSDVPSKEWLDAKRADTAEDGRNKFGMVKYRGSITAWYEDRSVLLPVALLKTLPGQRGEQGSVRDKDLESLLDVMSATGRLPQLGEAGGDYLPYIEVIQGGEAWVNQGNHRIMSADKLGWTHLPVLIRYYNGAERDDGPLQPDTVIKLDGEAHRSGVTLDNYGVVIEPVEFAAPVTPYAPDGDNWENKERIEGYTRAQLDRSIQFDGVVNYSTQDGQVEKAIADSMAADKSGMIRPSTQNVGSFDPVNPDIRFSRVAEEPVKAAAFDQWFEGSKVITPDGKPLRAYHGTSSDFSEFSGLEIVGWFAADPSLPNVQYLEREELDDAGNDIAAPNIMPVFLSLKNPLILPFDMNDENVIGSEIYENAGLSTDGIKDRYLQEQDKAWHVVNSAEFADRAAHAGYDGIEVHEAGIKTWAIFRPAQAKSAIGNNGNFYDQNPDIRFSRRTDQTATTEFGAWFGDSIVKTKSGKPKVVFHGTKASFTTFNVPAWFSDKRRFADAFSAEWDDGNRTVDSKVIPVYLSLKNPYHTDDWNVTEGKAFDPAWVKAMQAQGFDGVRFEKDGEVEYIVFEANQIKSADLNKGVFDPANPDIRFSRGVPVFYSALERAIPAMKAIANKEGLVNGQQAWKWLTARQREGKFKAEELALSGLEDLLSLGEDKIQVADIEAFVRANGVRVEEVIKDANDAARLRDDFELAASAVKKSIKDRLPIEEQDRLREIRDDLDVLLREAVANPTQVKYGAYQLPGGTNYKELLLTMPDASERLRDAMREKYPAWTGLKSHVDVMSKEDSASLDEARDKSFTSAHWDGIANVVAHIRFNDRIDSQGKRVLFIEEIQSDWNKEGKKKGFAGPMTPADTTQLAELGAVLYAGTATEAQKMEWGFLADKREGGGTPVGPFVSDTKSWVSLAIKRMIRYAAENGYASVAFINGKQSSDRYDLSKQVSEVQYDPERKLLKVRDLNENKIFEKIVEPGSIEEYIGKDAAKKLLATPVNGPYHHLSGDGMKFGGEGMATFYDQILPQIVNDMLKKLDGGKLGNIEVLIAEKQAPFDAQLVADVAEKYMGENIDAFELIRDAGIEGMVTEAEIVDLLPTNNDRYAPALRKVEVVSAFVAFVESRFAAGKMRKQMGFEISPAMREVALAGQPMFSRAGAINFTQWAGENNLPDQDGKDYSPKNPAIRYFRTPIRKPWSKVNDRLATELSAVRKIAEFFEAKVGVVRLEKGSDFNFNGVHLHGAIWLNEASTAPLHAVFGHELTHAMKRDRPDLYEGLHAALKPLLVNREGYINSAKLQGRNEAYVDEEMVADLVGDRFMERSFWQKIADYDRSLFGGIADYVTSKIEGLRTIMATGRAQSLKSHQFVTDLDAAREAIVETMAMYAKDKKEKNKRGFFESFQSTAKKWFVQVPSKEDVAHITTFLAADIDADIRSIYAAHTKDAPHYGDVFDWLTVEVPKRPNHNNVIADLIKVAINRNDAIAKKYQELLGVLGAELDVPPAEPSVVPDKNIRPSAEGLIRPS